MINYGDVCCTRAWEVLDDRFAYAGMSPALRFFFTGAATAMWHNSFSNFHESSTPKSFLIVNNLIGIYLISPAWSNNWSGICIPKNPHFIGPDWLIHTLVVEDVNSTLPIYPPTPIARVTESLLYFPLYRLKSFLHCWNFSTFNPGLELLVSATGRGGQGAEIRKDLLKDQGIFQQFQKHYLKIIHSNNPQEKMICASIGSSGVLRSLMKDFHLTTRRRKKIASSEFSGKLQRRTWLVGILEHVDDDFHLTV